MTTTTHKSTFITYVASHKANTSRDSPPQKTYSTANLINWRTRHRTTQRLTASPTLLSTSADIPLGQAALDSGQSDSETIPINSPYLSQYISHWIAFSSWTLIRPSPFSSDIVQGLLGNCWFLSALALVAERTDLLKRILPTSSEEFAQTRRAIVRLFHQGRWHSVAVDDVLPVNKSGQLVFSQAKRNQLFVPLIEKALAKLYTGYDHLRGGLTSEGMTLLTGFPCEILWLPPNRRNSSSACADEQWIKLVSYASAGFLIGASCGRTLAPELGSKADYKKHGLLKEHAYSVLDVISLGTLRLVKLRNPWGTLVWNGPWSDRSALWTTSLRASLVPEGAEEGIFWISFEDLCRYFEMTIVCKIQPTWFQYAFECSFPHPAVRDARRWSVYELMADERLIGEDCSVAEVAVTLYQERASPLAIFVVIYELLNCHSSPVIGPLVGSSLCNIQASVTCEAEVHRGKRYLVGVFAFNDWWSSGDIEAKKPRAYVLRINSSKPLFIESFPALNAILLGDMLTYYVKTMGKPIYRPNVITYQLNTDWAGLITVVENHDPTLWLQISMRTSLRPISPDQGRTSATKDPHSNSSTHEAVSFSHNILPVSEELEAHQIPIVPPPVVTALGAHTDEETGNCDLQYLASTRNTLVTRDLVPPGHCQLVNVITNRRPITSQHISIKLNFRFQSFETWFQAKLAKGSKSWDTSPSTELFHKPAINDSEGFIYGLHCPRVIS